MDKAWDIKVFNYKSKFTLIIPSPDGSTRNIVLNKNGTTLDAECKREKVVEKLLLFFSFPFEGARKRK